MKHLGIIAEDHSDVEVLSAIIRTISRRKFRVSRFVGHGCGKLRGKCRAWGRNLYERGCTVLIVAHDLDQNNLRTLRADLVLALSPCSIARNIVVIPVREIEAWLLADSDAITRAMHLKKKVHKVANPEAVARPKEHLEQLVSTASGHKIRYQTTIHNVKIAKESALAQLRRCQSFLPLESFVDANV